MWLFNCKKVGIARKGWITALEKCEWRWFLSIDTKTDVYNFNSKLIKHKIHNKDNLWFYYESDKADNKSQVLWIDKTNLYNEPWRYRRIEPALNVISQWNSRKNCYKTA